MGMISALQFTYWQWLALAARDAGRALGRLAVPRRRLEEPAPRRGDDGHADLARHARGVGLVGRRALLPRRGRDRHEDAVRARAVAHAPAPTRSTSRSRRSSITFLLAGRYFEARAKRSAGAALRALVELGAKEASVLDADGTRAARPDRASSRSATCSSSGPARRSRPTASSSRATPRSTSRCSPARAFRSRSAPATRSPARPSTSAAGSSSGPSASARTPRSRRSRSSSPRRSPGRRRCSASPTASRRSSSRS